MECERFNEQLSEYVDGLLGAAEMRALREHLTGCQRCREDVAELERMKLILRNMKGPIAPNRFWPRMYAMLRAQRKASRVRFVGLEWPGIRHPRLVLAVTGALVLLLTLLPFSREHSGEWELHPDDLISLHAFSTLDAPLNDHGRTAFVISENDARSLAAWSDETHGE